MGSMNANTVDMRGRGEVCIAATVISSMKHGLKKGKCGAVTFNDLMITTLITIKLQILFKKKWKILLCS